jgi:hypothetical protein
MLTRYRFRGFIAQRVTPRYVSLLPVFVFSGGIFTSSSFVSIGRASSMAVAGLSITGEGSATVRCGALVLFSPIAASADRLFNSIVRAVETRRSPALQEVVHCCGTAPLRRPHQRVCRHRDIFGRRPPKEKPTPTPTVTPTAVAKKTTRCKLLQRKKSHRTLRRC